MLSGSRYLGCKIQSFNYITKKYFAETKKLVLISSSNSPMAEEAVVEPKFRILEHGNHNSMHIGRSLDQEAPVSAEPAIIEESKVEPPRVEPTKPEVVQTTTPIEVTPLPSPEPTKSWKDSLKDEGFDEKFITVAEHFKAEGTLKPYLEALTTDVGKMSEEQVLRYSLQKTYPKATPEELELLYETDVKDKYKLDEEKYLPETVEAKAGRAKMRMDVENLRTKITEDLNKFTLPSFDREAETKRQQEALQTQQKAKVDSFYNDDYVKTVIKDKKVVIGNLGSGVPDFNMVLKDPSEITGILTDTVKGAKAITDEKGNISTRKQMLIGTFASDIDGYNQQLINYGKSLGREELIEEKHNPPKPKGTEATLPKETLKEAIANRGIAGRGR
jgi:hypothetical protein